MTEETIALLRCPLCRGALTRSGGSLVCAKRHCFDVARQGHVNLVPAQRESFYRRELFESRAAVFAAGVFAPVVKAIGEVIDRHVPGARPGLVDAGCGEGYYTKNVCPGRAMERIGFDLSKEAVKLAARGQSGASFVVGDLANIPLQGGCADVLLDVFTPANYAEFARVLKPGGVFVKLWPRSGYLCQLRRAACGLLRHDAYDDSRVADYLGAHAQMLERRTITYTLPVDAALAAHLARMTPMLADVDLSALDLGGITEITIDMNLVAGTFGAQETEEQA